MEMEELVMKSMSSYGYFPDSSSLMQMESRIQVCKNLLRIQDT
jgi:hypothetical protein